MTVMRILILGALGLGSAGACRPERALEATEPRASAAVAPDASVPSDRRQPQGSIIRSDDRVNSPGGPAITPAMRERIHVRMVQHGRDMARLQRVTLDLEYDLIEQASAWMAEEPAIHRPDVDDRALLREGLPPRFFQLEAEMRGKAVILRGAALDRDDEAIAITYGRLAETCIRCHALYRAVEGEPGR